MTIDDIIAQAVPHEGNRKLIRDMASLSKTTLTVAASVLDGRQFAILAWNAGSKVLVLTPVENCPNGLKAHITKMGSATFCILGVRNRFPDLPIGKFPLLRHGAHILIGKLPAEAFAAKPAAAPTNDAPAVSLPSYAHDAADCVDIMLRRGDVIDSHTAQAIAERYAMSVSAVRTLADKAWRELQQNSQEIQALKASHSISADVREARVAARAAKAEAELAASA